MTLRQLLGAVRPIESAGSVGDTTVTSVVTFGVSPGDGVGSGAGVADDGGRSEPVPGGRPVTAAT